VRALNEFIGRPRPSAASRSFSILQIESRRQFKGFRGYADKLGMKFLLAMIMAFVLPLVAYSETHVQEGTNGVSSKYGDGIQSNEYKKSYPWDNETFEKKLERNGEHMQIRYIEGRCAQWTVDKNNLLVQAKELPKKKCAPFIIAEKIKSEFGECSPQKKELPTTTRLSIKAGNVHLEKNCMCFNNKFKLSVFGNSNDEAEFAKTSDCIDFFDESKRERVKQIIHQVYLDTK
jgi:hypothetical protein